MKLTILVFPVFAWVAIAATVSDLFNTKSSGPGSCDSTQNPIIESWLADTITLVDTALNGIQAFSMDKFLQRNMAAFFSIRTTKAGNPFAQDQAKFSTVESE